MSAWRLKNSHNKSISLLLIVALVFFTIWPAHFHVSHADESGEHGHVHKHVVDMHSDANDSHATHHQDAQVLKASPDGVLKTQLTKVMPFLLLAIVLAVMTIMVKQLVAAHRQRELIPTGYLSLHSPPLRGPPALS